MSKDTFWYLSYTLGKYFEKQSWLQLDWFLFKGSKYHVPDQGEIVIWFWLSEIQEGIILAISINT